jgi:hypothetical protein
MCEKCIELDQKIEHYRLIMKGLTDQQALDGINSLIEETKGQKADLHPDSD